MRKLDETRRDEGREFIREYKLAHGCIDCGYNRNAAALEFDHKPGHPGRHIGSIAHYSIEAILKEIAKCELRCANCHKIKTFERGQFHQQSKRHYRPSQHSSDTLQLKYIGELV